MGRVPVLGQVREPGQVLVRVQVQVQVQVLVRHNWLPAIQSTT